MAREPVTLVGTARCPVCGGGTGPGPQAKAESWAESHTKRTGHTTVTAAVPLAAAGITREKEQ